MSFSPAKFTSAGQTTQHYIPGVYSRRNTIGGSTGVSSGNLCIIGVSDGGQPLTLHCVSDKAEAKQLLTSGSLLEGVANAFSGSNTYVPQQVYCMRVNNGQRSSLELGKTAEKQDKDGGIITYKEPILRLYSADYGTHTNRIKLMYNDTSVSASFDSTSVDYSDIGRNSFYLDYGAAIGTVNVTIDSEGIKFVSTEKSENLTILYADYKNVSDVVNRIVDSGIYSATLVTDGLSNQLDYISDVNLTPSESLTVTSNLQALIDTLSSIDFIGDVAFVGTQRVMPDDMDTYGYFEGGTAGESSIYDWMTAIDELAKYDIQIIATPSQDEQVQALILDHCVTQSTVDKKKERTCWFGLPIMQDAITYVKTLNSELCSLVDTGAVATNPLTGETETISSAMLACKCAGIESALSPSNPLTNKVIKVNSFVQKHSTSDYNNLIKNGVCTFGENDEGELVCIRSVTTYQGDSLILNERSMIRSVLYMDRDLRKAYNRRIGTNAEPCESTVIQTLLNKAKEWYADDLLTKDDNGNLVFNPKVKFDGDKIYLTFDRYIRAPNNFIFITGTNRIYSSTVEV